MTTIVHVIGQLIRGGAERQLIYLAEALQNRGWPQVVITFGDEAHDTWGPWVKSLNIPLYRVQPSPLKPYRLAQLARVLVPYRGAVLQSWSLFTNFYAYLLPPLLYNRLIFCFRANPTIDIQTGAPVRVPYPFIYPRADCVISNSQTALDAALQQGVRIRRSAVVNNIITIHGRGKPGQPAEPLRIFAAGTLSPRKSYDVLLRALANVQVPYELLLAGSGTERDNLERMARDLHVNVRFLGEVDDVPALMSSCHLVVHPSVTEGLSNTILEAMAEGLPVVTTIESGSEWMTDGDNGVLVPAARPDLLAEQISRLAADADLRVRIGQSGLRQVSAMSSSESVTAQFEAIYRSLDAHPDVSQHS